MPRRIAIVEDEIAIRQNFEDALRRQGYQVSGYGDRQSALAAFSRRLPDLVIIDVGLGDDVEGGFELCRELRSMSRVLPIMFLTARDSDPDVISGLRLGADDYLTKDISLPHLMARIVVLFRRVEMLSGEQTNSTWLERDALRLSAERMEVQWNGQVIPLTTQPPLGTQDPLDLYQWLEDYETKTGGSAQHRYRPGRPGAVPV